MPFKGMLKWAIAKEDLKQSATTTTTSAVTSSARNLKNSKRRHQQHHNKHTCCALIHKVAENNAKNICNKERISKNCSLSPPNEVVALAGGGDGGVGVQHQRKCEQNSVAVADKGANSKKLGSGETRLSPSKGALDTSLVGKNSKMGNSQSPQKSGRGMGVASEANNNRPEAIPMKRVASNPNPMSGGNRQSHADSKSLLYMSLDHLPLAIVKQYERMLQETNAAIPTSPIQSEMDRKKKGLLRSKTAEDVEVVTLKKAEVVQTKKKTRSATVVVNPKDLKQLEIMERKPLQGIIKETGNGGQDNPKKMVKIISPASQAQQQQANAKTSVAPVLKIKEAKSRQLPVHSADSFNKKKGGSGLLVYGKRKSPSPDLIRHKSKPERSTQAAGGRCSPPRGKGRFKVTIVSTPPLTPEGAQGSSSEKKDVGVETEPKLFPLKSILKDCKSSTLPRSLSSSGGKPKKTSQEVCHNLPPTRSNSFRTPSPSDSSRKQYQSLHNLSTMTCAGSPSPPVPSIRPHDLTDPQFLEMPISSHTPAVSRCAKKLTLKRSEIRKLQRIQNQTEKLNRFLKKYYRLPNLPEEEEEACSPEEKSVHLSALRKHWIVQNGPEEGVSTNLRPFSRRNTLPTHLRVPPPPPLQEDDEDTEAPSNLLSSSAFYSDPLLSSFPNKIESPELLLEHHRRLTKQKSCTNLRRSSVTSSCSSSCSTCSTSSSSTGSCTNSSCKGATVVPSLATSIINSSSEYRQTEVHRANKQYSHSIMNESFLMMSSSHHGHHGNPDSEDDDQDNSLLALQERELLLRRCPDSTKNLVVMPTVNGNTELPSSLPVLQESFAGQAVALPVVAIASPAPVVELACVKNDTNNNSSLKNNGSNKSCGSKVMMISPISFSDEECSSAVNSDGEEDDDELLEADQHPNPQSEKTCENHTLSAGRMMMMMMRRGEEDDGKLKGWKTRRTIDNDQQHDQDGEMITGGKQPLKAIAAKKKNPFEDMPPVLPPRQVVEEHAEDEGFMSPYPHEGYSPSGSHSSGGSSITSSSLEEEKIQRLSVSSGKGSSAEDLQEEDEEEENLELFFLDSTTNLQQQHQQEMRSPCKGEINHLNLNLNNYFNEIEEERRENGDDDEEDYVTLSGTSNSSATTNTTAVCGSFFPNSNSFQIGRRQENCHGRQVSSDDSYSVYYAPSISISSSCGLYATVAGDDEENEQQHEQEERGKGLRCENSHLQGGSIINYYDIPEEREREHIYDEVAVGQEDGEQSVIIQSAHLQQRHGGNFGGIAFSTPINKERVNMAGIRRKRSFNMDLMRDSSCLTSSVVNGSLKAQMRKSTKKMTPKPRRVITKKYTTPLVKKTPYSGKGEVLLRCYRNGNYVTVHVIQARSLQMSYRSSWKLSMKISLIPEGEGTLTKCESVTVARAKGSVRIDQKFSFELPSSSFTSQQACSSTSATRRKVFLTFIKRIAEKRSSTFLGWITLEVPEESYEQQNFPQSQQQHWLKLRKRKMSNVSYSSCGPPPPSSSSTQKPVHLHPGDSSHLTPPENSSPPSTIMVGLPPPPTAVGNGGVAMVTTNNHHCYSSDNDDHDHHDNDEDELNNHHHQLHNHHNHHNSDHHHHHHNSNQIHMNNQYNNLKINCHIQNSNTMDSGVEDCCERESAATTHPQVMAVAPQQQQQQPSQLEVPCIELDDKLGFRVRVRMEKQEGSGFGFSVVWVSPPRIERLEKDKTADVAGLKIGDLIIGVNGDDVTNVPNTIIYNKMKSTGTTLDLEVWRKHPHAPSPLPPHHMNVPNPINPTQCVPPPPGAPPPVPSGVASPPPPPHLQQQPPPPPSQQNANPAAASPATTALPKNSSSKNAASVSTTPAPPTTSGLPPPSSTRPKTSSNPLIQRILEAQAREQAQQQNPQSILKPPQQNPPGGNSHSPLGRGNNQQSSSTTQQSSSWRIRFNIELLDNEDDNLKQFFICELKFFRKVVAALDRYLIPAQAKRLLTPQEIHLIFAQVIKIITMTKRILQCVANGSNNSTWKLGRILLSTHTDHLPDITSAYTAYARGLAHSAMILSEKMSIKEFAKFVVETPVPKGHLDMTSLLFAPFEHLRNLCEIAEEISHHHHDNWVVLNTRLKECYADIVCETDFMEPISHLSMKKNPLLSVRDLEKRIISTTSQQPLKVCEKGRKWLFGSRLYRRENDGSWSPVWAFLFTDIIVLTSHMTRDRVFFVKETPIRLDDVVTLHFNLPKKHENEFRLLFGPDSSHHSRLDRILPLVRSKKPNQVVLRTANTQLKSLWKLLLQRQIISLNTRLSKSSSSNFSISEFCEKFPVVQHDSIMEEDEVEDRLEVVDTSSNTTNQLRPSPAVPTTSSTTRTTIPSTSTLPQPRTASFSQNQPKISEKMSVHPATPMPVNKASVKKPIPIHPNHLTPDPLLPPNKEIMIPPPQLPPQQISIQKAEVPPRSSQVVSPPYVPDGLSILNRDLLKSRVTRRPSIPPGSGVPAETTTTTSEEKPKSTSTPPVNQPSAKAAQPPLHMDASTSTEIPTAETNNVPYIAPSGALIPPVPKARTSLVMKDTSSHNTPTHQSSRVGGTPSQSPIPTHNNNNNTSTSTTSAGAGGEKCPCEKIQGAPQEPQAYPSPKPRQLSALKRTSTTTPPPPANHQPPEVNVVAASPLVVKRQPTVPPTSAEVQPSTPKSKPGSRIMTNATIKSMASQQQQQQQSQNQVATQPPPPPPPGGTKPSISTETIKTDKSSDTSCTTASKATEASTTSTQYFSLKEESSSTTSVSSIQHHPPHSSPSSSISSGVKCGAHLKSMQVHHQHHAHHCPAGLCGSGSPHHQHLNVPPQGGGSLPPRCHSENSHHPLDHPGTSLMKKGKPVHTDSPIIGTGFSSERARRRMLFDNKLKKDYPELFGITPKDRRSFIKQLGETTEEVLGGGKALVAPYYYTLSPVPIAKHAMMMTMQLVHNKSQQQALGGVGGGSSSSCAKVSPPGKSPLVIPPFNPNGKKSKTNKVPTSPQGAIDDGGGGGGGVVGASEMVIPPKNGKGDGGDEEVEMQQQQYVQNMQKFKIRRASAGGVGLVHENSSSILEEISSKNWQKTHHYSAAIEEVTNMFREGMMEEDEGQRLKEFVEKMRQDMESKLGGRRENSLPTTGEEEEEEGEDLEGVEEDDSDDEEEEDEEEEDSDDDDDSTPGDEEEEGFLHSLQGTHSSSGQSHRSHEESSNDSGISDEMTEKSKSLGSAGGGGGGVVIGRLPPSSTGNNFASRMMMSQQEGGGGGGGAHHHPHLMEAEVKNCLVKNGKKLCKTHSSSSASSSSKTSCSSTVANNINVSSILKTPPPKKVSSMNQSKATVTATAIATSGAVVVESSQCVVDVASCALLKDDKKLVKNDHSHDADKPSSSILNSLKGEATGSVEAVVVLKPSNMSSTSTTTATTTSISTSTSTTADKATETTEDDFNFLLQLNNKPLRSILAERREAFFTSGMQPSVNHHHHHHNHHPSNNLQGPYTACSHAQKICASSACNCANNTVPNLPPAEPLIVKIVEGGTLHSTKEECPSKDKDICCERVQLQRLERQKKAKVERVESSEDSTSSSLDLASASPGAAENGTTDPSWSSSSSSSLAGEENKAQPRKTSPTVDVATSTADTMISSTAADLQQPPQPLPPGVEVEVSSVVAVVVDVAPSVVSASCSGVTTKSCCSSVTFEPSSASSSSFQESSTTSSKSYSLLLESDFSSFDSIEPPPSTSTSNGGDNIGGGGKSQVTSITNISSSANQSSTKHPTNLVTIDEPCGGSGGSSTSSTDDNVSSKNSSSQDSISSNNNNNNNNSEMNKLLVESSASDIDESNDKIDDNSGDKSVTCRFPIFGGGLGGDGTSGGNNRVVVVVSKNVSDLKDGPDIVVTQESDEEEEEEEEMEEENSSNSSHGSTRSRRHFSFSSEDEEEEEEDSIVCNGKRGGGMEGVVVGIGEAINGGKGDTSVASEDEEDGGGSSSINSNRSTNGSYKQGGGGSGGLSGGSGTSPRGSFHLLRVESNDSSTAAENFGDDDDLIGGFGGGGGLVFDGDIGLEGEGDIGGEGLRDEMEVDGDEEEGDGDLSHCSVATINRYGTFESLEKLESEDTLGAMPDFPGGGGRGGMSRSKARFTFEDEDDDEDDEDLFEEDFETDFNFRFPSQIQDNTYSVSRLGPLPPLLEEDYEDDMYDETRASGYPSSSECSSSGTTTSTAYLGGEYSGGIAGSSSGGGGGVGVASLRSRHETGLRRDNSFLLARLATMYARSSISPLKILRELWLKKSRQQPVPAPAPQQTPDSHEQQPDYHHQQSSFSPSSTTSQTSPIPTMAVQGIASYTPQSRDSSMQSSQQQKLVLIKSSDSEEMIFLAETSSLPDSPMVMMAVVPVPLSSLDESSTTALEGFSSLPPHPPPPPEFSDYPITATTTLDLSQGESSQVPSMSPEGNTSTSSSTISPAENPSLQSLGAVITENSPTNTSI